MRSFPWLGCLPTILVLTGTLMAEPVPFPVDWRSPADSPASLTFLLDAPAGKDGFIRSVHGHLARPDGRRISLWGVNVSMAAGLPEKENAPLLAARLAQHGVNCVRFHFFDILSPRGIIDATRNDTQAFDKAGLDRLDFFVAQLKKHGIYSDINLNVARRYKEGDQVREYEQLGYGKGATYFDNRLLELQRDYARQLLCHKNPYTGNEYRNEPAVALVELINENSLVESWYQGRLLGKQTEKSWGGWQDIPPSYEKDLTGKYQAWLAGRLSPEALARLRKVAGVGEGQPIPRLTPREFGKADKERFHTEASFYMDIERQYFLQMGKFLKEELKVQQLLLGTSDHNHSKSGYPLLSSASHLDVVDGHVYWQHPHIFNDPSGKRTGFEIRNTAMVNEPLKSTPVQLARSAVAGKPYVVSEVNHPFPAEHACEGIPILAAYACLQDWDGIFWYTFAHQDPATAKGNNGSSATFFDLAPDPVKMAQLSAGALTFLRRDVQAARRTINRRYSAEQVRQSIHLSWTESPLFTPGFPAWVPLVHGTRIASFDSADGGHDAFGDAPPPDTMRSDTGELTWRGAANKQGLVTIDTDRFQALIGHSKGNNPQVRNLTAQVQTEFCAITLNALDDRPIAKANKLLLTLGSKVSNTGMQWNEKRTTLEKWGTVPVQIEPVTGSLMLRSLDGAKEVSAHPLDGAGRPMNSPVTLTRSAESWVLPLAKPAVVWYLVNVTR